MLSLFVFQKLMYLWCIKVLMGKTGDSTAKAVNHMLIQT